LKCADDIDSDIENREHVLPALVVLTPWHVGVRDFIDDHNLRFARNHRINVQLRQRDAAVGKERRGTASRPASSAAVSALP
jgi:hypothetical protein